MTTIQNTMAKGLAAMLLLLVLFASCEEIQTVTQTITSADETEFHVPDTLEGNKHYYHAYLAYCTSNYTEIYANQGAAEKAFTEMATKFIKAAIIDPYLKTLNGHEKTELAWGPVVKVDQTIFPQSSGFYLSNNLMYALKHTDLETNLVRYSVGIAGTNPISGFDWFVEDFSIDTTMPYMYNGVQHGVISKGSNDGLEILKNMTPHNGKTLKAFLREEVGKSPSAVEISTSGHSLGGALAPLMALELSTIPNTIVSTWTYAGPTTGNLEYANFASQQLGNRYYAYQNQMDLVPHGWNIGTMNELCDLFGTKKVCSNPSPPYPVNSSAGPFVKALLTYFKMKASATDYHQPPNPIVFPGTADYDPLTCVLAYDAYDLFSTSNAPSGGTPGSATWKQLGNMINTCSGGTTSKFTEADIINFFLYLGEMAKQHSGAYLSHFIGQPNAPIVIKLNHHIAKPTKLNDPALAEDISAKLLNEVGAYLQKNKAKITNCNCNS